MNDSELRAAYSRLLAKRASTGQPSAVSLETIAALAEGGYRGPDRIAQLDRVLADPRSADEYTLLRELVVATATPRQRAPVNVARLVGIAASIAIVAGVPLYYYSQANPGVSPATLRGPGGGSEIPQIIAPADGATIMRAAVFTWHAIPLAAEYRVEIVDDAGRSVLAQTVKDSTLQLPDSVMIKPGEGYVWWVVAKTLDGADRRSTPAAVKGAQR